MIFSSLPITGGNKTMQASRLLRLATLMLLPIAGASASAQSIDEQISRITSTMTPSIVVKGAPEKYHTLADTMAKYNVPGVSIALIHDGKLAWAQGFGFKTAGSKDAVTSNTLFQAASISKPVSATAMLRLRCSDWWSKVSSRSMLQSILISRLGNYPTTNLPKPNP